MHLRLQILCELIAKESSFDVKKVSVYPQD